MSILNRLKEVHDIPTLPEVVLRVQRLASLDDTDARKLAVLIEHDPSLAAKVLRMANSVFFTPANQRITDIAVAITRIGMREVRNIAIATAMIKRFPNEPQSLSHRNFWRHALAVAYLAETIAHQSNSKPPNNEYFSYFIAGLLHDIGILVYDQFFHEEFKHIMKTAAEQQQSFLQVEERFGQGQSHASVGGALLEIWKLSSDIVSAVRYHHHPDKASEKSRHIVNVTHAAETILCNSNLGSFEGHTNGTIGDVCTKTGVNPELVRDLITQAQEEVSKYDSVLNAASTSQERLHYV